jgi:hypothetical protein
VYLYNFNDPPSQTKPNELAVFANREAKSICKLIESWKVRFLEIKNKVNHSDIEQLVQAKATKIFLGYFLSILFLVGLYVEWNFSYEVYDSQGGIAFLFFLGLVLSGLYCSAAFGTVMAEFRENKINKGKPKDYFEIVYNNKITKKLYSFLKPSFGIIIFLLTEVVIYNLSQQRVLWLQDLGMDTNDLWLPVIWFAIEVLFGIGFHYTLERLYVKTKYKSFIKELSDSETLIQQKIHSCLDIWQEYQTQFNTLEQQALKQRTELPGRIEANQFLKMILDLEYGLDIHNYDRPKAALGFENQGAS